jgi:hypothetical protein
MNITPYKRHQGPFELYGTGFIKTVESTPGKDHIIKVSGYGRWGHVGSCQGCFIEEGWCMSDTHAQAYGGGRVYLEYKI